MADPYRILKGWCLRFALVSLKDKQTLLLRWRYLTPAVQFSAKMALVKCGPCQEEGHSS